MVFAALSSVVVSFDVSVAHEVRVVFRLSLLVLGRVRLVPFEKVLKRSRLRNGHEPADASDNDEVRHVHVVVNSLDALNYFVEQVFVETVLIHEEFGARDVPRLSFWLFGHGSSFLLCYPGRLYRIPFKNTRCIYESGGPGEAATDSVCRALRALLFHAP